MCFDEPFPSHLSRRRQSFRSLKGGEKSGEMLASVKLGESSRRSNRRILLTMPATVTSVVGFIFLYNFDNTPSKSGKCENSVKNWPDYVKITPQNSTDYVKSAYLIMRICDLQIANLDSNAI